LSAFRTREDRQPTSKFVVPCPCPDGLMQDGTQEGNGAYVISHRGACSRGYKRRARARLYVCLPRRHVTCLRKALDIPFYRCKECPAVQWGVAASYRCRRRSALSPVDGLSWPSEKHLESCRSTAVGVAWILLTLSCFRRRLRVIRRHGRTWGTIITCYRSNLRWDIGLVPL
jgi:hypothetical protein